MYPNKEGKTTRKSAQMNKELLDTFKQEVCRWWKQGQVVWVEYRAIVQGTRDQVKKVKAQIEICPGQQKSFYRYIHNKRKIREMWALSRRKPGYPGYGEL